MVWTHLCIRLVYRVFNSMVKKSVENAIARLETSRQAASLFTLHREVCGC